MNHSEWAVRSEPSKPSENCHATLLACWDMLHLICNSMLNASLCAVASIHCKGPCCYVLCICINVCMAGHASVLVECAACCLLSCDIVPGSSHHLQYCLDFVQRCCWRSSSVCQVAHLHNIIVRSCIFCSCLLCLFIDPCCVCARVCVLVDVRSGAQLVISVVGAVVVVVEVLLLF